MSDSSERSDNNDEDDDRTGADDNNCYGNGDGSSGGERNTGAGGSSTELLGLLSLIMVTEVFGVMEKAKASSLTKSRNTRSWEKLRIK